MDAAQVRNALNHAVLDYAAAKAAAQPTDGPALRSAGGPASRPGEHHDRLNRIGLPNVDRRIKVRYGDSYGLALYSRAGKGTVVALRLPATAAGAASAEPAAAGATV
jgi:LytS/YehU family sensor histidine kinase